MGFSGQRVRRVEDPALLTGAARFTADLRSDQESPLVVHFVRSTMAHATFSVNVDGARDAPGIVSVLTAADLGDIRGVMTLPIPDEFKRPIIATDLVRFVGEIVAVIVAHSLAQAVDAAEMVEVDYLPRRPLASIAAALDADAPALFPAVCPTNVVLTQHADHPDPAALGEVCIELEMINQRIGTAPLEGAAVMAVPTGNGLTVSVSTQSPHAVRDAIAERCGLAHDQVRVIAGWVGGAFGGKSMADAEHLLVAKAALHTGRAVRWVQDRTENLHGIHGRAQHQRVRVGVDRDGTLRSIHADLTVDNGAYPGFNHFLAGLTATMMAGPYRFRHASANIDSVTTTTHALLGFRGAGRPEATSLIERVVDVAARDLGIDPAEMRRRNLIAAHEFPYTSAAGSTYDCGDYGAALDLALRIASYDDLRREQRTRRLADATKVLGIGLCTYVEVTAGFPPMEYADVTVDTEGHATVHVGTFGHGQGHHTTYAQIAADALGLPFDTVSVVDGDTARVARGGGTFGSRSMQVGGSALRAACELLIDRARSVASTLVEAAFDDIVFESGRFAVAGVPTRTVTWSQVADHLHDNAGGAGSGSPTGSGLFASVDWERPASTYPFGAHLAVVEVDIETGSTTLVQHVAVDDCGTQLNPMIVEGQVHGGIAQGVGQALHEELVYDEHGVVLTSNLADYAMLSAAELPSFTLGRSVTPTPVNPLGAKGIGESGTIGATPAVHNAVIDAVAHLGVRHIDMPCTPERVWRAIHGRGRIRK